MAADPTQLIASLLGAGGFAGAAAAQGTQDYNAAQLAPVQLQQNQQNVQLNQQKIVDNQAATTQAAQYQQDEAAYAANPTPDALNNMIAKYPNQFQALQAGWKAKSDAQKQSDLGFLGSVYGALKSGRTDLAVSQLQSRQTAERNMGHDTTEIEQQIEALKDNNPSAIKSVQAFALAHIAAADTDAAKAMGIGGDRTHVISAGGALVDDDGNQLYKAPSAETDAIQVPIYGPDGTRIGTQLVANGGRGATSSPSGGATGTAAPAGAFDAKQFFHDFVLPHEGGYAAHDANGAPVNMGVNQSANPGVDVRNLTKDQAADIFANKYAAKAANLPPALAAAYSDTAYINPARADQFLMASGGDVSKFLAMRKAWQGNLVATQPDKYAPYAKAWANRNRDLAAYVSQQGGAAGATAGVSPGGSPSGYYGPVGSSTPPSAIVAGDISTVPAPIRATVQAITDGRSAAPRPGTRNGEALLDAVTAFDPTFDAANATSRVKTRVDFTSGKSAQAVNSINTSMGHLFHLDDQVDTLGNAGFFSGLVNPARRAVQTGVMNNTAYTTFDQTKIAAASEMRKVFSNSNGGTLPELQAWESSLDSAKSPQQLHDAIKNGVILMSSRLDALKDQYANGMGRSDKMPQFIKPMIVDAARHRFGVDLGSSKSPTPPPANQSGNAGAAGGFRILSVRPK